MDREMAPSPKQGLPVSELAAAITKEVIVTTSGVRYKVKSPKINIVNIIYFSVKIWKQPLGSHAWPLCPRMSFYYGRPQRMVTLLC